MENFGIFCLFAILIAVLVESYHILINTWEDDREGSIGAILLFMTADLFFMYYVFHHGLWMILRDR